jgi:signal transduction histidine kinase/streptogramin lyase
MGFAQDRSGVVWANTSGSLRRFDGSTWESLGEEFNLPIDFAKSISVARDGSLWVATGGEVMVLRPGQSAFEATAIRTSESQADFLESPDGTLWLTDELLGARAVHVPRDAARASKSWIGLRDANGEPIWGKLVDRDGTLWTASPTGIHRMKDVAHLLDPKFDAGSPSDVYTNVDGLSAPYAAAFLEDREGNVWIGTAGGLDRFRESRLTPVDLPRASNGFAIAAGDAGAMLVGIDHKEGTFEVKAHSSVSFVPGPESVQCAYRADDGVVWLGGRGMLWHSSGSSSRRQWIPLSLPIDRARAAFHEVQGVARDGSGRLWVSALRSGVMRFADGEWTHVGEVPALSLAAGRDGRIWAGYLNSRIHVFDPRDDVAHELSASDGLDVGNVMAIHAGTRDAWIGGDRGLSRFDGRRFHPVTQRDGMPLPGVSGIVVTPEGDLWLSTSEGALKIGADEVRRLEADPRHAVQYALFNFLDGMPGTPNSIRPLPSIAAGTDGRLWFGTSNGIVWIDPKQVKHNRIAPDVEVLSIVADGRRYQPGPDLELPIGIRTLQITYTAPSLSIPERVRFRYQLGAGEPWQDAGPRRTAYFTDLAPGGYSFRVIAANEDGVWNETGAAIDFAIPPAFHQTRWFYGLCVLALVAMLTLAYKVRVRQVAAQVRGRLEVRLAERERIARDLHDTLLQGVQGLIWRFQATADRLRADEPARRLMEQSLDRADRLLAESRDKVKDLHRAAGDMADLAQALASEGEQLSKLHPAKFRVSVEGANRDLHPIVREEGFLVSREALSNAFQHAHANSIEAEITYGNAALHIRIRDDGQGISSAVLDAGEKPGHFGLIGMRERARKLGAHLEVWSKPGAGTEVELRVPANVAYRQPQEARGLRAWLTPFRSSAQEQS